MDGSPPPIISFIIVNLNTEKLLLECLASVQRSARDLAHEIWVVDNGSADGSVQAVKKAFPMVRVIENGGNLGFARANNLAIAKAAGEYLVLLNTDAMMTEAAARNALAFMAGRPEAAVCGAQLLNADGTRQNSIANIPGLLTELTNKSLLRLFFPRRFPGKESKIEAPAEVESVIGAFMAVRKKAVEQAGPMDEDFFFFFEETDWCARLRKKGWKIYHHPGVQVVHLQGRTARKNLVASRVEYWKSRYLFFSKNRGLASRVLLRAGLFVKLAVDLLLALAVNLLTCFLSEKKRDRLKLYVTLLLWHLAGCPGSWGLRSAPNRQLEKLQASKKNKKVETGS